MAENCILSRNVKFFAYFVSIKTTLSGQDSIKIIVFYTFLMHFSSIFGFYKSSLHDVKKFIFFIKAILSLF